MQKKRKIIIAIICLLPLLSIFGCQTIGLHRIGLVEREDPVIEEEHRRACDQPANGSVRKDKCGRLVYGDGKTY